MSFHLFLASKAGKGNGIKNGFLFVKRFVNVVKSNEWNIKNIQNSKIIFTCTTGVSFHLFLASKTGKGNGAPFRHTLSFL